MLNLQNKGGGVGGEDLRDRDNVPKTSLFFEVFPKDLSNCFLIFDKLRKLYHKAVLLFFWDERRNKARTN